MTTSHRRAGSRAPLMGLAAAALALLLLPSLVLGADWTSPRRVTETGGSRLDSLHQLAAASGRLHLVHPRIGPGTTDDRVIYQRSADDGRSWSRERVLFTATNRRRHVVPNLAIDARGAIVAVAWRVDGPKGSSLFVRTSTDGGKTFGGRIGVFATRRDVGIGVPAIAVGDDVIAVAWTNRSNGKIKLRLSRDGGRSYKPVVNLGSTSLSIACDRKLTDGLVGLAATGKTIHLAWSHAPRQSCIASSVKVRTSTDRGLNWSRRRNLTERRSYGWPELDARGRTVLATIQSPGGRVILARSGKNGRAWSERVLRPATGHNLSAADVILLPRKKAMIVYVDEALRNGKLVRTKILSRRSPNDGAKWNAPRRVVPPDRKLRLAPNIAANDSRLTIVFQAGQLDGSTRNIFASRLR